MSQNTSQSEISAEAVEELARAVHCTQFPNHVDCNPDAVDLRTARQYLEALLDAGYVHRDKLAEELDQIAEDMAGRVDWSDGRSNYGDNEAYEAAARTLKARAKEIRNG